MNRKLLFISTLFIFCCPLFTYPQSPEKVLKKALKTQGGERALKNITSYKVSGNITRLGDGAQGIYQVQASQPNFIFTTFDIDGFETKIGYNGKSGWMRDSKNGLQTLTGTASRDLQAEANYRNNLWLNYKKERSKLRYAGQTNISGKPADTIVLTTAKGVSIKMYFDTVSGLLIREEIPFGEFTNTFDYSDFRIINGIQEPFSIKAVINNENYEINLDSFIHNQQISSSLFD